LDSLILKKIIKIIKKLILNRLLKNPIINLINQYL